MRRGPAEKDPKSGTIRASRSLILGILVELTNVPRMIRWSSVMPAASKCWANTDNTRVYFLVLFAANPRSVCTNSKYGVRIVANQSGIRGGEPTRRRNCPRSSVSRKILTEARSTRERLALVPKVRWATYCRTVSVPGGRQKQTSFLEAPGEAQPFVKLRADYLIRVAQFQQTTSNFVRSVFICGPPKS